MDIAIEIPCSCDWNNNPLTSNIWAEVPSPRFHSAEAAVAWLAARVQTIRRPMRILESARGWGVSGRPVYIIEAQQNRV